MSSIVYQDHNGVTVVSLPLPGPKGGTVDGHYYETGSVNAGSTSLLETTKFQNGPVPANGINGTTTEAQIAICIHRLEVLNSQFSCVENEQAIEHLKSALQVLEERIRARKLRGVEGKEVK